MDVHRCRFIPYPASSINALAFSHNTKPEQKTPQSLRLALGRANGDIEIWNPGKGIWCQECVFRGGKNRSVEGLVWTQDLDEETESGKVPGQLRLFSIGYSSAITEWNLATGMPLRHSSGSHAEVWSLAAQPRWRKVDGLTNKTEQLLAVGCADGSIVLHSTADGELSFVRVLRRSASRKARVLSLTFCDRNTIAAGCSDGSIWIYDIRGKGKVNSTMHLGTGPNKSSVYVWTVKCLSDNVLVSGDSTGELKFWDLKTFTITQRLLCHDADILSLASNAEGTQLFSGGMDRKTCMIAKDKSTQRWKEIYHQKVHAGQVKAMTSIETKHLSIVVSGGIDAAPVLLPLRTSGLEFVRALPGLPQSPPIISAPRDRLVVSWWEREIAFCELDKELLHWISLQKSTNSTDEVEALQRILLQGEENISSVSISTDGRLLAVATNTSCKIFVLSRRNNGSPTRKVRRLESENLAMHGARHVAFSPDGQWLLLVRPNNEVSLQQVQADHTLKIGYNLKQQPIILREKIQATSSRDPLRGYTRTICKVAWSEDSKTVVCANIAGHVNAWTYQNTPLQANGTSKSTSLASNGYANGTHRAADSSDESEDEEDEDSSSGDGEVWQLNRSTLPRLPSTPLLLSFRPRPTTTTEKEDLDLSRQSDERLMIVTMQHEILEFHARTGHLTDWSKRNASSQLPTQFRQIKDRVMGCVWDVSDGRQRLWFYGSTFVFMLNMGNDLPLKESLKTASDHKLKRKRSQIEDAAKAYSMRRSGAGDLASHRNDFGLLKAAFEDNTNKANHAASTEDDEDNDNDEEDTSDEEGVIGNGRNATSDALLAFRRRETDNEDRISADEERGEENTKTGQPRNASLRSKHVHSELPWWFTHKYRPILGLVVLEPEKDDLSEDGQNDEEAKGLEVALIERPLWDHDLDLPFLS